MAARKDLGGYAPKFGQDCSDEYVESYRQSHLAPETEKYRLGYLPFMMIDDLLRDYSLLDVGCGTAGYYRLLRNAATITGVDYSEKMLAAARELTGRYDVSGCTFVKSDFERFDTDDRFDAVRLGVYGTYEPFDQSVFRRVHGLLNDGGIAVFANATPRSAREHVSSLVRRSPIRRSNRSFERLVSGSCALTSIFKLSHGHRTHYFFRK